MSCDKSVEKVAKPRILVAEDNFGNYKLAEVILRRDYDVLHADNGEEAVEIFQSQGADLVLMDIRMPVMDGINAFHGIRQISPAVPVIALTAYTYDGDRQFLIAEGFNDYIIKPYTSEILRNHVSALLLDKDMGERFSIRMLRFVLIFFLLCSATRGYATPKTDTPARETILIISSYNPDTQRMSSFISAFEQQILAESLPCDIFVETLECKGVGEASRWIEQTKQLIMRYEQRHLRAIILLGQEAWSSFVSVGYIPKDVLCFSCFVSTNGIMLPAPHKQLDQWTPESVDFRVMGDTIPTLGGLLNRYDINRNIDLIQLLYPNVENVAFVSDNTYGGISLQALVRKEWPKYPHLKLILIDSRKGEPAMRRLYASLPARTAVLLGTWRVGANGEYLMQSSLNELVNENPKLPVFSVTGTGIGDVAIGGYVPTYENGATLIASQLATYYVSRRLGQIHFHLCNNQFRFDSRKLKEWKIPEYSLPKESVIEDTLAAKLTKYSHYIDMLICGVLLLVVLLTFVIWLLIRTQRLKKTLEEREEQLVIAREKAVESDLLKSAFLANMSHEIRTPLNAIVGFSSLMQGDDLTNEERTEYSALVVSNSEMLLTLLNDILDISSLECGKIHFNYEMADIVPICQTVILTTTHVRTTDVEIHFDCPVASYEMMVDTHRLQQVLINLMTNASKYTEKGSITLGVEIDEQNKEVRFSVTDTGPGIAADKQDLVFNRFEKLDGKKQGTGLGLAICRQIAVILGGRIWVDPDYRGGARFIFAHPIGLQPSAGEQKHPLTL